MVMRLRLMMVVCMVLLWRRRRWRWWWAMVPMLRSMCVVVLRWVMLRMCVVVLRWGMLRMCVDAVVMRRVRVLLLHVMRLLRVAIWHTGTHMTNRRWRRRPSVAMRATQPRRVRRALVHCVGQLFKIPCGLFLLFFRDRDLTSRDRAIGIFGWLKFT